MSEGRVAQVVSQAGRGYNLAYLLEHRTPQFRALLLDDALSHVVAQRHTYTGHLQRVGQSVVYKDASWQGKHLCLVLQSAKGSREDQSVVVTLKLRAVIMALRMTVLLSQSLVRYQLCPFHNGCEITNKK